MLRNKKGLGGLEVVLLAAIGIATALGIISSKVAKLHHEQRAEKQAAGDPEYPIVVKEEPHMTPDGWSTAPVNP